jgi:hypothetical protein
MSTANNNAGPASCMKFNSSFLYYVGFFILLVVGYMWGKRNGTAEERKKDNKNEKPIKPAGVAAVSKVSNVASNTKSATKKIGSSIKNIGKK